MAGHGSYQFAAGAASFRMDYDYSNDSPARTDSEDGRRNRSRNRRFTQLTARAAEREVIILEQARRITELEAGSRALAAQLTAVNILAEERTKSAARLELCLNAANARSIAAQEQHDNELRDCRKAHARDLADLRGASSSHILGLHDTARAVADKLVRCKDAVCKAAVAAAAPVNQLEEDLAEAQKQCIHLRACLEERDALFRHNRAAAVQWRAIAKDQALTLSRYRTGAVSTGAAPEADMPAVQSNLTATSPSELSVRPVGSDHPCNDLHSVPPCLQLGRPALEGQTGPLATTDESGSPSAPSPELAAGSDEYDPADLVLIHGWRLLPTPPSLGESGLGSDLALDLTAITATLAAAASALADHSCGTDYPTPEPADQHAADALIRAARELCDSDVVSPIRHSLFSAAIAAADTSAPLPRRRERLRFSAPTVGRSRSPPVPAPHVFLAPSLVDSLALIRSCRRGTRSPEASDSDDG
jgi:hypothetical protein